MRDPQATDEASEAGLQPKATAELKLEDLQATAEPQPGAPKASQEARWTGPDPGAGVLSPSRRLRGGVLAGICPSVMVVVEQSLGKSGRFSRGPLEPL